MTVGLVAVPEYYETRRHHQGAVDRAVESGKLGAGAFQATTMTCGLHGA